MADSRQSATVILHKIEGENEKVIFQVLPEPNDDQTEIDRKWKGLGLTRREIEVSSLVCQGLTNKQISKRLYVSRYTVENHLKSIFLKTKVNNRTGLTHKLMHL